ncbi:MULTISPECIES: hypothetical protein [Helicobacter]|uniref:hypothetical protein n=1 Tax=Helicobacter TaxID=209 RepID=UPI0026155CD7|nr:hypothetical protein [Helicobacter sp. UBA3407]
MGAFSYSNAHIPRLDIKMGRYNSIALGLSFISGKHPLDIISTSSFTYCPNFVIFKDANLKFVQGKYQTDSYTNFVPSAPPTTLEHDVYVCPMRF